MKRMLLHHHNPSTWLPNTQKHCKNVCWDQHKQLNPSVKKHGEYFGEGFAHENNLVSILHIIACAWWNINVAISFNLSVCIGAMYPVHFDYSIKRFTQSFHSSCVLKTKCYPIGFYTKRMHCPFSGRLAGSTSHACFRLSSGSIPTFGT